MTLDRKHKDFTKKLARLSLTPDGQIESSRVDAVLASLRAQKPRLLRPLLKAYLRYLQIEDRRSRLLVEHAGTVAPAELESLRAKYTKQYRRELRLETRENAALLAGLRMSIGDDIYETSAANRLTALANALA